jgi:hypothetical protein
MLLEYPNQFADQSIRVMIRPTCVDAFGARNQILHVKMWHTELRKGAPPRLVETMPTAFRGTDTGQREGAWTSTLANKTNKHSRSVRARTFKNDGHIKKQQ